MAEATKDVEMQFPTSFEVLGLLNNNVMKWIKKSDELLSLKQINVLDHVILNQKAKGAISNLFAMNIGTHDDIGRFYEDLPFKKGVDINEGNSDLWKQSRFKEINEINTIGLSEEHFFDKELEESRFEKYFSSKNKMDKDVIDYSNNEIYTTFAFFTMIYNFSEHKEKKQSNFMETLEKKLQDTSKQKEISDFVTGLELNITILREIQDANMLAVQLQNLLDLIKTEEKLQYEPEQ